MSDWIARINRYRHAAEGAGAAAAAAYQGAGVLYNQWRQPLPAPRDWHQMRYGRGYYGRPNRRQTANTPVWKGGDGGGPGAAPGGNPAGHSSQSKHFASANMGYSTKAYKRRRTYHKRRPSRAIRFARTRNNSRVVVAKKVKFDCFDIDDGPTVVKGILTWRLQDFPDFTPYQSLYEEFRIAKVVVTFRWDKVGASIANAEEGEPATTYEMGAMFPFYYWADDNDVVAPTLQEDALTAENVRIGQCFDGQQHTISMAPKWQSVAAVSGGNLTNTYGPMKSGWVSCANSSAMIWGGVKWFIDKSSITPGDGFHHMGHMYCHQKIYVQFRGQKNA